MKIETLLDHPRVRKTAVLRKGIGFMVEPAAWAEGLTVTADHYAEHPPVFANSLPKSGTHLVLQITRALPQTRYLGRFIATSPSLTQIERSPQVLARKIGRILPGETLGSHLYYWPEVQAALSKINALHLFIYRDPRDVITSEAYYLSEMNRWHRMHKYFKALPDDRARLDLALDGLDARYPDCNARLLPYAGWVSDPGTIAIRYEDIAGAGQGNEIMRIVQAYQDRGAKFADIDRLVVSLKSAVKPDKSHTFREGGFGKWRRGLSDTEAEALSERLRPSLEAFGY